ncbi:hypothetical protein C7271_00155 [filamentous cyanobacterium CCP5]|nr:hypothetical protein C7271_00155 [filamentous cyanobacterium CCP5]
MGMGIAIKTAFFAFLERHISTHITGRFLPLAWKPGPVTRCSFVGMGMGSDAKSLDDGWRRSHSPASFCKPRQQT